MMVRRRHLLPLLLLLPALAGCTDTVFPRQALIHAGQVVTVRGPVDGVHERGDTVFLDIDGNGRHAPLVLAVTPGAVDIYNDSMTLAGKTVAATGRVEARGKQALIVVDRPWQMVVKD